MLTGNGRMILKRDSPPSSEDQAGEDLQPPIYFSNPDLLWANEFPRPRFGQGAFQEAVKANYLRVTGKALNPNVGGKPSRATFQYADRLLRSVAHALDQQAAEGSHSAAESLLHDPEPAVPDSARKLNRTYMIGDSGSFAVATARPLGR